MPNGGRNPGRPGGGRGANRAYDSSQPTEDEPYDDLSTTKAQAKEKAKSRSVGFGGFGFAGFGDVSIYDHMADIWSSSDFSSDDEDLPPAIAAERRSLARMRGSRGGRGSPLGFGNTGFGPLNIKTTLTGDFRNCDNPSQFELPRGLELIGGPPQLEPQEEGGFALPMPEVGFLKCTLPVHSYQLAEDGRLHAYTMLLAIRLEQLPSSSLRLFSGGAPPAQGEKVEHVQVHISWCSNPPRSCLEPRPSPPIAVDRSTRMAE